MAPQSSHWKAGDDEDDDSRWLTLSLAWLMWGDNEVSRHLSPVHLQLHLPPNYEFEYVSQPVRSDKVGGGVWTTDRSLLVTPV